MKLKIADRISIMQILPEKDTYVNLCYKRDILKKIEFSAEELDKYSIKTIKEGDKVLTTWKPGEEEFDVNFKAGEVTFIMEKMKEMSVAKELTSFHVDVYEKFSVL